MNMIDQLNITDFQVFTDENSDKSVSKIYKFSSKMILSDFHAQPFTAIYSTADILAAKLNQIFKDISIVGVDNAEFDEFISPKLTTVAIDQVEKGKMAMSNLIDSIENEISEDYISDSLLLVRDSVKKL